LLDEADEAERQIPDVGYGNFSNEAFLLDHAAAIRIAAYLIWLANDEPLSDRERRWLDQPSRYFEHSRIYLNRLVYAWEQARVRLGIGAPGSPVSPPGKASISNALQLCDQEEEYLENTADLFEPQRTQYVRIIGQWREQIWKRAEDAIGLLDVLDKFNRHTYRASSDKLMSSITELALQAAPLWSHPSDAKSMRLFRSEIQQRLTAHPLVRTIFDSGHRLVASTHLAGTLFVVARDYYRASSAPAPRQTSLEEIGTELVAFCQYEELKLQPNNGTFDKSVSVPGTLAVWDTVLQEIVVNARKYCKVVDDRLFAAREQVGDRTKLAFAGGRPFIDCLDAEHRSYVDSNPSESYKRLLELVALTKEPGQRLAPPDTSEEGSSGMGLPLILRICGYLGMDANVVLRDLDPAAAEKVRWPLCIEISWKSQP
jgi:hypothetical protein